MHLSISAQLKMKLIQVKSLQLKHMPWRSLPLSI